MVVSLSFLTFMNVSFKGNFKLHFSFYRFDLINKAAFWGVQRVENEVQSGKLSNSLTLSLPFPASNPISWLRAFIQSHHLWFPSQPVPSVLPLSSTSDPYRCSANSLHPLTPTNRLYLGHIPVHLLTPLPLWKTDATKDSAHISSTLLLCEIHLLNYSFLSLSWLKYFCIWSWSIAESKGNVHWQPAGMSSWVNGNF